MARRRTWPIWVAMAAAVAIGLRVLVAAQPIPQPVSSATSHLVVIGVTGRTGPNGTDRSVITSARAGGRGVQLGAISIRTRHVGACAAAGWTTLGAGRAADAGGLCRIRITPSGSVADWSARTTAATVHRADARLGTLAAHSSATGGCLAAVGPGAGLAAAHLDGTNADYRSVRAYVADHYSSPCRVTLVDPGPLADEVISAVANLPDTTVIVTGIGPPPGSHDPALQVIYRLGGDRSGWLTSPSTRRTGTVTLPDVSRTIADFAAAGVSNRLPVDGAPLEMVPADVTATDLGHRMSTIAALVEVPAWMFVEMALAGAAVAAAVTVCVRRRRWDRVAWLVAAVALCPLTMMLVGATRWWRAETPLLMLSVAFWGFLCGLVGLTIWCGRTRRDGPAPMPRFMIIAAVIIGAGFSVEALSGGFAEPGSLLDSRPTVTGRWYGFGNVTFAADATAVLVVAGWAAARLPTRPHRRIPGLWRSLAVLAIGLAAVLCDGWPTLGADVGGVLALTPVVLWLALAVSGLRPRWWVYPLLGLCAVATVSGIAVLDWLRPPAARSHLGRFVQSIIAGGAADTVWSKLILMIHSLFMPLGLVAVVLGVGAWWLIFRWALPRVRLLPRAEEGDESSRGVHQVGVAVFATAILGTLLNDGGVVVWTTMTGCFAALVCLDLVQRQRDAARERNRTSAPDEPAAISSTTSAGRIVS